MKKMSGFVGAIALFLMPVCLLGVDAASFGFSPDATGKANQAALQKAFDQKGTVTVSKPGRYKIAGTVYIGSDTTLDCASGVVFVKSNEGKTFSHVILNKGALSKTWDQNICIKGLEISVNGMDRNDWQVFGLRGQLAFFYARDVKIERFRCYDLGAAQYCIHICTFEDVLIDDVIIKGKKDGVHFGGGKRFAVRNGVFDTGDDPIALNAHDYSTGNPELGWIEDGVISNCHDLHNPTRHVGYFCRLLAGAWTDWNPGMEVQQSDTVVANGALYRVQMPPDGKKFISKTAPSHKKGHKVLDGINWGFVQTNIVRTVGVRNVVFRDIFLHHPRIGFSVHFDADRYSRSYYPGAPVPRQEGILFDNVQVLHDAKVPILSIATPVDSVTFNNCAFRNSPITFVTNRAMKDYERTQIAITGSRFYAKGAFSLIDNRIANKKIDLLTSGNMIYEDDFKATVKGDGSYRIQSDLPGLKK